MLREESGKKRLLRSTEQPCKVETVISPDEN